MRFWLALASALATVAVGAATGVASPCYCGEPQPRELLERGEPAVVGTVTAVERQGPRGDPDALVEHELIVHHSYNRRFPRRLRVSSSRGCGVNLPRGRPVGLVVGRVSGRWFTNTCWSFGARALDAAAKPYPRAAGHGELRLLLGGRYGRASLVGLDPRGRPVAYGTGGGDIRALDVCPGGRRSAEVVWSAGRGLSVGVRKLRSFRLVRRDVRLGPDADVVGLACLDQLATRLAVFTASGGSPNTSGFRWRSQLRLVSRRAVATIHRGRAERADFGPRQAFLIENERLVAVDMTSGRSSIVARLPGQNFELAASPQERFVAAAYDDARNEPHVALVDCVSGRVKHRSRPLGKYPPWTPFWLDRRRLVFNAHVGELVITDLGLRTLRRPAGWSGDVTTTALAGRNVYGYDLSDQLIAAYLPHGRIRRLARFPLAPGSMLAVTLGGVHVRGGERDSGSGTKPLPPR